LSHAIYKDERIGIIGRMTKIFTIQADKARASFLRA
jgi:hypothetical protein